MSSGQQCQKRQQQQQHPWIWAANPRECYWFQIHTTELHSHFEKVVSTNHLPSQIPTAHKTHSPKWAGSPKHKPANTLEAVHHNLQRICNLSSQHPHLMFFFTSFSYISHWTYSYKPHDGFFCISSAVSTDPISWMCARKLPHLRQALVQRRRQ